jgi:tetratricopeptide (TPR) repeat protein
MRSKVFFTLALAAAPMFAATRAELAIRQADADIEKQPSYYGNYNALAMAYARRARETCDAQFYAKAEEALRKSFAIAPDNFDGTKVGTFLQLERHEYARALESAAQLNKRVPDDLSVYGYLVDANVELGNYQEAIEPAQWMLDLRPGNTGGLLHAANLRELHGNLTGALELVQMAYNATAPAETEDRAWMLAQASRLEFLAGDMAKAESYAQEALAVFPDHRDALAALAHVRQAQGRDNEAVTLLRKRYDVAPRAENLYALAEAQELAGQHDDAQASYRKFEQLAQAESGSPDNSNRELILYYVDSAGEPAKALAIARREIAQRHDVLTLDAYAWALAANGDYAEANRHIQAALQIGLKNPTVLAHAQLIAKRLDESAGH